MNGRSGDGDDEAIGGNKGINQKNRRFVSTNGETYQEQRQQRGRIMMTPPPPSRFVNPHRPNSRVGRDVENAASTPQRSEARVLKLLSDININTDISTLTVRVQ